jgi:hypothetical protein
MAQTPVHHDAPKKTVADAPLVMPLADPGPVKPTPTIGVKGEPIEDGERDPDTIAARISLIRTKPRFRRRRPSCIIRRSKPWLFALLGICRLILAPFRLMNQEHRHLRMMLICLGGREAERGLAFRLEASR